MNAWVHTYTKPQTSSTRSRGLGRRIHESVEDTKLSTNKQHTLSQRGPLATFDALLQAYLDHNALVNDAARAAFLRERAGFKPTPGETFRDGPGGLAVLARLFDAVLRIATTGMVARYYGPNEELGLTLFLGAFEGEAVGLARTALADTPHSDGSAFRLHGALSVGAVAGVSSAPGSQAQTVAGGV